MINKKIKINIIGLGYVGLPLAIELGKKFDVLGYDNKKTRINELLKFQDVNNEFKRNDIKKSKYLKFTYNTNLLRNREIFIITVPTPIFKNNKPNLNPLIESTRMVANLIESGNTVIYESTVYPGATEEVCAPIIEEYSGLKLNKDFYLGYSPERINPGDKKHNIRNITKIVSGSNKKTLKLVNSIYKSIIDVGTYQAESIQVAEAAKVIENIQRDLNIALINEFSIIFDKLNLNTNSVLKAAETKWNFIKFYPGLVGGHCIGVDPYYLTYKSKKIGYDPFVILAGRKMNNSMPKRIISKLDRVMSLKKKNINGSKILIMGITFKENCSDIRNSKALELYYKLSMLSNHVECYDTLVNPADLPLKNKIKIISKLKKSYYDAIIISSPHDEFKKIGIKNIRKLCKRNGVIFDIKSIFPRNLVDAAL